MNGTYDDKKSRSRSTCKHAAMKQAKLLDDQGSLWAPSTLMNGAAPACNGISSSSQHAPPPAARPHPSASPSAFRPGADPSNHWAHVWDVGARAAAAAAAAHSKSKLGQWARLRREARGGSVLPAGDIKALGEQYNCLEHEFEVCFVGCCSGLRALTHSRSTWLCCAAA